MFTTSTSSAICNTAKIIRKVRILQSLPRDLDRRFRSRDVDRRRSSPPARLPPGGPPRRVEPRPPPKKSHHSSFVMKICVFKEYAPNRLGRQPLTVRPRSTSTTTRRPSILRPSARLYAAENEVLTVNTIKSHRPFDHVLFFSYRIQLTLIANLIDRLFLFWFSKGRRDRRDRDSDQLTNFDRLF